MRYIRYACIAIFAIALIAVALANRNFVTLNLLPDEISGLFAVAPTVQLPLFIVIFGGILTGLLVGFGWEWLREHTVRAENARNARDVRRLEREVKRLKTEKHEGKDEVLALLDVGVVVREGEIYLAVVATADAGASAELRYTEVPLSALGATLPADGSHPGVALDIANPGTQARLDCSTGPQRFCSIAWLGGGTHALFL